MGPAAYQETQGEEEIINSTRKYQEDRIMAKTDTALRLLVVIDHQEAKVYRTEHRPLRSTRLQKAPAFRP